MGIVEIALIWAQARNGAGRGVIGAGGAIPWHLPEDFAHFKALTDGHPIIMGERTWVSLPRKPLPNRTNIVLSQLMSLRDSAGYANGQVAPAGQTPAVSRIFLAGAPSRRMTAGYEEQSVSNPRFVSSLGEAFEVAAAAPGGDVVWVVGGESVYRQAIEFATGLEVTDIDIVVEGDTFAPPIPPDFCPVNTGAWQTAANGTRYRFVTFARQVAVNA